MIRRTALAVLIACLAALLVNVPAATAADTTVDGRGAIDKLWFANQSSRLVFRVFAPGRKCQIENVGARFQDRDGTKYQLEGRCVSHDPKVWRTTLSRNGRTVDCDAMRLVYKPTAEFWRGVVDRDCLRRLGNKVRIKRAWLDTGTRTGKAGPTRWVARG